MKRKYGSWRRDFFNNILIFIHGRYLPYLSISWKFVDLRRFYYVWIDGEEMKWWAIEGEIPDLKRRYKNIEFKVVPLHKTILR